MQINLNDIEQHFPVLERPSQDILRAVCECGWEREFALDLGGVIMAPGKMIKEGNLNAIHSFTQIPPEIGLEFNWK